MKGLLFLLALFFCVFSRSVLSQSYVYPGKLGISYGYSKIVTKYDGYGHSGALSFGMVDVFFGYSEAQVNNVTGYGYNVGIMIYKIKEGRKVYPGVSVGYAGDNENGGLNLGVSIAGDLYEDKAVRIIPEGGLNILLIFGDKSKTNYSGGYNIQQSETPLKAGTASVYGGINVGYKLGKVATLFLSPGFNLASKNSYFIMSVGLTFGIVNLHKNS